jgi:sugar phosphate isomerase/epimerase
MQIGFVSAILPDLSLEEVVTFAGSRGFGCVELMCWPPGRAERRYAGVTHLDVTHFGRSDAERVRELMEAAGIEISGLGYYPNPLTADREEAQVYIDHLRKIIAAAGMLGLTRVNTVVGRDPKKSVEDNWARFREVWVPLIQLAEDHGVNIGIENCPMLFTEDEWPGGKNLAVSPAIWRRMFEEIPSQNFGLNYDPSHMVWQQMDVARPIREFADRIHHVHAKDVRVDRDRLDQVGILAHPLEYHTPKLPGLGQVNWSAFFAALTDIGYEGPVCIEVEDRAYEGSLDARKRSLVQSKRFLENYLS